MGLRASDDVIPMEAIVHARDVYLRDTALDIIGPTVFFRLRISRVSR